MESGRLNSVDMIVFGYKTIRFSGYIAKELAVLRRREIEFSVLLCYNMIVYNFDFQLIKFALTHYYYEV
jgi:hypothetical protein